MAVPLDAIRAIHNAFRKDMAQIDDAAYAAAKGQAGIDIVSHRYNFFNDVLVWHARGKEEFVFTALEKVAPLMSEAYQRDHRGLDSAFETLHLAVLNGDPLIVARATAAFKFHLDIHLNKEEAHLYRIYNERVPMPEQAAIGGKMSQKVPAERFPEVVRWLYPLLNASDRENMTRIWQKTLPPSTFINVLELIKGAIGTEWADLANRIPELK